MFLFWMFLFPDSSTEKNRVFVCFTGQGSNMYFVPKDVPLSSRSTTTTIEEIEEEMETTEEATFWGTNLARGGGTKVMNEILQR